MPEYVLECKKCFIKISFYFYKKNTSEVIKNAHKKNVLIFALKKLKLHFI